MSSDRQRERARKLFLDIIEEPVAEWESLLNRIGGHDSELRLEVEALLNAHVDSEDFLEPSGRQALSAGSTLVGQVIGRYRIVGVIAEGGMGVVYDAIQESPQRSIALKFVRSPLASSNLLHRFRYEAEVLGRLQHPCIAQVYEAGTSHFVTGPQPYIAMEKIDGQELHHYLNSSPRAIPETLELLARICDGVQHAHQKGVIHRDLKPGNILVTESGEPKVVDFGIARSLEAEEHAQALTAQGERLGTLAYMSPEQVSGREGDLDTRTDVYSLGVILYQALSGELPFNLRGLSLTDAARTITDQPFPALSHLVPETRGDIETVVKKATEKDRDRRYGSAADLAADLRRVVANEPILARPPRLLYQFQKFTRRHRGLVIGLFFAAAALLVASVMTWTALVDARKSAQREKDQTQKAERSQAKADSIATFLRKMFETPNVFTEFGEGINTRVIDVLRNHRESLEKTFREQPEVALELHEILARTFRSLGSESEAVEQYQRGMAVAKRLYRSSGEKKWSHRILSLEQSLARLSLESMELDAARETLTDLWKRAQTELGSDHPLTLRGARHLAEISFLQGDPQGALQSLREIIERQRGQADPTDELSSLQLMGDLLWQTGDYQQAEPLIRSTVLRFEETFGATSPRTLMMKGTLADFLLESGRAAEAIPIYRSEIQVLEPKMTKRHHRLLHTRTQLGVALSYEGHDQEGIALLEQVCQDCVEVFGEKDVRTLDTQASLASLYQGVGRLEEAQGLFQRLLPGFREKLGETHYVTLDLAHSFAMIDFQRGNLERAEQSLLQLREQYHRSDQSESMGSWRVAQSLAMLFQQTKRFHRAAGIYAELFAFLSDSQELSSPQVLEVLEQWSHSALEAKEATEVLELVEEVCLELEAAQGLEDEATRRALRCLLSINQGLGRENEVERLRTLLQSQ